MAERSEHQQRPLVMSEDGAESVVDLIDRAREHLMIRQFNLDPKRWGWRCCWPMRSRW